MSAPSRGVKHLVSEFEERSSSQRARPQPITARFLHQRRPPATDEDVPSCSTSETAINTPNDQASRLTGLSEPSLAVATAASSEIKRLSLLASSEDASLSPNGVNTLDESHLDHAPARPTDAVSPSPTRVGTPETAVGKSILRSARTALAGFSGGRRSPRNSYFQLTDIGTRSTLPEYATLTGSLPGLSEPLSQSATAVALSEPGTLPKVANRHTIHHHSATDLAPVEARTLFSRAAAPLQLPELDAYLEKLEAPNFPGFEHKESHPLPKHSSPFNRLTKFKRALSDAPRKFPPMELLSNTTFADLKHNAGEPPIWGDRNTIFGIITGWVLGLTSSSAIATFYSLQGIYDSVQIFALILTSVVHISAENTLNTWKKLFLGTVPNILALNISVLTQSIVFFTIFQIVTLLLVLYFHHATDRFVREQPMHEGLVELPEAIKGRGWDVLFVSFLLIILYLPISTLTVHGLVWTSDFWPVPNPYLNATTFPPQVPPLGPSWEYRDPLDFCWTTTMKKDSLNWAPFVVIFSLFSFTVFTVYFPVRLWLTIRQCLPHVDKFSELGRLRNASELEQEYQRLLVRDSNPLSFLYNDFRRTWGAYKSIYLVMKLLALLTVAVIDPNNCIFRNSSHSHINIIRQSVLLVETVTALIFQSVLAPFIDPISNASEWISRVGYVATSFVGLLVATNVKGSDVLNGPVLYVIYVLNYGLNIYFAIIGFGWVRLIIKRIAQRLDFSIDMFSPQLDISSNSVHVKRRIYQESVSALLLASPSCLMPKGQKVVYNEPSDSSWPPYLMGFMGSPAERHAENLKIMREVGADAYKRGVDMYYGPKRDRYKAAQRRIEREFVGPDAFWHPEGVGVKGCSHYFGNAWWIPFPPSLVLRYDHGPVVVLTTIEELEAFVAQNASLAIEEKRKVRLALRALDGHIVVWPHTHIELVGARAWNPFGGPQYKIQTTTEYQSCTFEIKRNGVASWNGIQLGSGFNIQMRYSHCLELDGSIIGLDDDFNMTPQLAQFLLLNRDLVNDQHPILLATLDDYRTFMRKMAKWKREVLSYRFLTTVYGSPSNPETVIQTVEDMERDLRVRDLVVNRQDAFSAAYERLKTVAASRVRTWWYLLWDDMWRQNSSAISAMRLHETDFNPQYPTSIAYRPLPRAVLEAFLSQRGLYAGNGKGGYIHVGFLNKVYVRMSQIAFNGASRIIRTHIGDRSTELDISEVQFGSHPRTSSLGTGGGTDHDDNEIRVRPMYRWEDAYDDPLRKGKPRWRWRVLNRLGVWFGITPLQRATFTTNGVAFDVELVNGHYVAITDND